MEILLVSNPHIQSHKVIRVFHYIPNIDLYHPYFFAHDGVDDAMYPAGKISDVIGEIIKALFKVETPKLYVGFVTYVEVSTVPLAFKNSVDRPPDLTNEFTVIAATPFYIIICYIHTTTSRG